MTADQCDWLLCSNYFFFHTNTLIMKSEITQMRKPELATLSQVKERTQVIILLLCWLEISLKQLRQPANRIEDAELSNQKVLNLKVEYNRVEANFKELLFNSNYNVRSDFWSFQNFYSFSVFPQAVLKKIR